MQTSSTRPFGWLAAACVIGCVGAGCLTGEDVSLGHDMEAGATPTSMTGVEGGSTQVQDQSLGAAIEAPTGTICAGSCVPLRVVATGGGGSYMYVWGQDAGEGEGPNEVCPSETTTYSVLVSSAASDIVATASIPIAVVACDGGAPGATPDATTTSQSTGPQDAQTTAPVEGLCVSNPSFEGATVTGPVGPTGTPPTTTPPDWQACTGTPSVDPAVSPLPALNGKSFVGLPVGSGMFSDFTSSLGTTLCSSLEPGVEYSFCINLGVAFPAAAVPGTYPTPTLQIRGGSSPCDTTNLLWESPPITSSASWTKDCPNFFTTVPISNIVLVPTVSGVAGMDSWSYVIVDDIVGGP